MLHLYLLVQQLCRDLIFIPDIYEKILVRLDARNLVRCKSVCQAWKSLISESRIIKSHYNHSSNTHKRIGEAAFLLSSDYGYPIIGSSCGLVCFSAGHELLVANPLTREVKAVPKPSAHVKVFPRPNARECNDSSSCWGFGYDSLKDDYMVVLGVKKGKDQTYFQVFSLKSNAWNVIGEVNYTSRGWQHSVLCNDALHWVMHSKNQTTKEVILSFNLSKEEFTEIPQPDDVRLRSMKLGIMDECLCIRAFIGNGTKQCVWKNDNEKQSWEIVDNRKIKYEYIKHFVEVINYSDMWGGYMWFIGDRKFINALVIVESLVSPHLGA